MWSPCGSSRLRFVLFFLHFQMLVSIGEPKTLPRPFNNSISALFVFGDSTVDPGNNNHINTIFRSDFPPYGQRFPNQVPTGRFTDGRLVTDFIAEYVGIKENIPPYLDKKLSAEELKTGVSFASAGSGLDPLTTDIIGVIPMQTQLKYFQEYKRRLEILIGKEEAKTLINKAGFIISVATNDFAIYYATPIRKLEYNIPAYQDFLLNKLQRYIQSLRKEGARMIAVVGLAPIGCVPIVITVAPGGRLGERRCNESISAATFGYNKKLVKMLKKMDDPKSKILYADTYKPIDAIIKKPSKYGFVNVSAGCCGTGLMEMSFLCNKKTSSLCNDPSKYLFFDAVHPTEAAYKHVFNSVRPVIDQAIKEFPR